MSANQNTILIISLDGATFSVLDPLIDQGYMPNLGALKSSSVSAELESVVPPVTAPAWTSFMTGKHPNKHGIFDFARFNPEQYKWTINNAQDIQSKTLWQILSEKHKRVVTLNLPYTYPPYEVNGILVSGWDAPFSGAAFSSPASVGTEILERFPDYRDNLWISELHPLKTDSQFGALVQKLKSGFEQQTYIASDLLKQQPWDVFMVHFQQTDWIQHKLWTYIERGCKDPGDHSTKVEETRNCYRRFDELVGSLIKEVEAIDPTIILISDHGFGRLMGNINPNFYLQQWGYLETHSEQPDRLKGLKRQLRDSSSNTVRNLYRRLADGKNRLSATKLKDEHQSWADNAEDVLGARGSSWNWAATKAAVVYAYQMGFLYVNVVGKGSYGIVQPGEEYEAVLADLISRFREIRHSKTGEKLLQDVVRGEHVYPAGDNGIPVPDLVLIPVDGYGFSFSLSDAEPQISEEGTHRHNGVVMIKGKSIKKPASEFGPQLIDVAPTIIHLLGLSVPTDMDGKVWEEIFRDHSPVSYEESDKSFVQVAQSYDSKDSNIIEQRLKGLGYL